MPLLKLAGILRDFSPEQPVLSEVEGILRASCDGRRVTSAARQIARNLGMTADMRKQPRGNSQHDDRDSQVPLAEIIISFQFGINLEQRPRPLV